MAPDPSLTLPPIPYGLIDRPTKSPWAAAEPLAAGVPWFPSNPTRSRLHGVVARGTPAGAEKTIVFQLASLTDVHWSISGEVALMTPVGGVGTAFGSVAGGS